VVDSMGIRIKADTEALDGISAVTALVEGRELYRVRFLGGKAHNLTGTPPEVLAALNGPVGERPMVIREHRCDPKAVDARLAASYNPPGPGAHPHPQSPPAGRTAPFSGPSSPSSSVPDVVQSRSDPQEGPSAPVYRPPGGPVSPGPGQARTGRSTPVCDECGKPCADGTYASIELGDLLVWAAHVSEDQCRS
jgi:hypothetical protein